MLLGSKLLPEDIAAVVGFVLFLLCVIALPVALVVYIVGLFRPRSR
jgi:hypothetical protein